MRDPTHRRSPSRQAFEGLAIAAWLLAPAAPMRAADVLEEIVVTATRRATELQETPASVSALTGEALTQSHVGGIVDWFARVPGLNYIDDGAAGHRTMIRGITTGSSLEPRPLCAWYLDDVPIFTASGNPGIGGQVGGPDPRAFDLARIEVLRGPQGTLFGSNALGGAVRMFTNLPEPNTLGGAAESGYSMTKHGSSSFEMNAVLNMPVATDRAALRLGAYRFERGGYIDNLQRSIDDIDSVDTTGGRLSFLWNVSDKLSLQLRAFAQTRASDGLSNADVEAGTYAQQRNVAEKDDETWQLYSATVNYQLPLGELTSNTAYVDRQPSSIFDSTPLATFVFGFDLPAAHDVNDGVRDFVQEFRLVSRADKRLTWVAGAYYQVQDRALHGTWSIPGFDEATGGQAAAYGHPDAPFVSNFDDTLYQRAIYGELDYEFARAWHGTVGARVFEYEEEYNDGVDGVLVGGPIDLRGSYDEKGITPRFGLEYRPDERTLWFINAAEGFRPGGTNPVDTAVLPLCEAELEARGLSPRFTSDSLWNYELGVRSRQLGGRVDLSGTVYYIDWEDMQNSLLLLSCDVQMIQNVGRATSKGLEVEVSWLARDGLELQLTAAYIDARLAEDVPNIQADEGERIPTVPDWTVSALARYEFGLSSLLMGFLQADYQYVAGAWNLYNNTLRTRVPPREIVNLRTGISREAWTVELYAENLLDERGVLWHETGIFGNWEVLTRPRTIGLRAHVAF